MSKISGDNDLNMYLCKHVDLQSAILYEFLTTFTPAWGASGRSCRMDCIRRSISRLVLVQFPYGRGSRLTSLATIPMVAETPGGMSNPSRLGLGMVSGCCIVIRTPSVPAAGSKLLSKPKQKISKHLVLNLILHVIFKIAFWSGFLDSRREVEPL